MFSPKGRHIVTGDNVPPANKSHQHSSTLKGSNISGGDMSQSLANVLVHIVFSTKNRYPFLIQPNIRKEMHAYLGGACKNLGCPVLAVGGVADHVHLLCALSRTSSIADIVREIKQGSSKWIKTKGVVHSKFAWQGGYGAFSVSQSQVQRVRTYIERQEDHHRKKAFQDEYRTFLKMHSIEYDERYLWD